MNPSISFIIPAYNEEDHLPITVDDIAREMERAVRDYEIIVINDGSEDKTGTIAQKLAKSHPRVKVIHNKKNSGLGFSCREGIKKATKDYIGWCAADTTWDHKTLREAIELLGQTDIVTTYAVNIHERPLMRRLISKGFTLALNLLFGLRMKYFNGGCFHRAKFLQSLDVQSDDFVFWAEALVRSVYAGQSYREIGIYNIERKSGESKAFRLRNVTGTVKLIFVLARDLYPQRISSRRLGEIKK